MKKIVNHNDTALSRCQILTNKVSFKELENYRGRALCLTSPEDIIQLPLKIKGGWNWIADHYTRIGLTHTKNVIWDSSFDIVETLTEYEMSVFMFTKEIHKFRSNEKCLQAVNFMNSKNNFIDTCFTLDVKTPKTICYETKENFLMSEVCFPLYLKADVSVSGLGVIRCAKKKDLLQNLKHIPLGERFQLQEEVDAKSFINVQYKITGCNLYKVAITEQILSGNSHIGNVFPSKFNPWFCTDPLANFLKKMGMDSYFAFDVAITNNGPLVIECNPRFNGATYPTIVAKKLDIPSWIATNIKLGINSFKELDLGKLEYDTLTKKGIIVINWGCILNKKLGVMIAGDDEKEQQEILRKTRKLF